MRTSLLKLSTALLPISLLIGCVGTRFSYLSSVEFQEGKKVFKMEVGESIELCANGDGFPGRFGYVFSALSGNDEIASVTCEQTRSFIPFREPGIIFGGNVCDLKAHRPGQAKVYFGNGYGLYSYIQDGEGDSEFEDVVMVIVTEKEAAE